MTAKKYLEQVCILDIKIKQKLRQMDELRALAGVAGGIDYAKPRVQTSSAEKASFVTAVEKISLLESEIEREKENYAALKQKIIGQIYRLSDARYIALLYKRYVEYKKLDRICREMRYSYDRVRHLHGDALRAFEQKFLKAEEF